VLGVDFLPYIPRHQGRVLAGIDDPFVRNVSLVCELTALIHT
jgi:hypothetical protein